MKRKKLDESGKSQKVSVHARNESEKTSEGESEVHDEWRSSLLR
jgi:hypothetical protein